jgi:uncharacterized protein
MHEFWAFALVGFFAQLVDGALGMGFGVISASVLLAQGVPPALVSASVNAAKLPTTGTAALSHYLHKNLNWHIITMLCLFGAVGGILGATMLTSLKGKALFILINLYLLFIGGLIIYRGLKDVVPRIFRMGFTRLIGFAGGLIEGIGGSWGPMLLAPAISRNLLSALLSSPPLWRRLPWVFGKAAPNGVMWRGL